MSTARSTATNKSSTGSYPFSTAASVIADLPDDRPRVSELMKFYELLIKGQLEEARGPQLAKIVYEIPEFQNFPLEFQDSHQNPDKFQNFQCIPGIFTEF